MEISKKQSTSGQAQVSARPGMRVLSADGRIVGTVTQVLGGSEMIISADEGRSVRLTPNDLSHVQGGDLVLSTRRRRRPNQR